MGVDFHYFFVLAVSYLCNIVDWMNICILCIDPLTTEGSNGLSDIAWEFELMKMDECS